MFLREFGLSVHPFGISPRLDFLYKSGAFEESIAHLVYGLDNSEAIVLITGAIGTGKTMAIQSFLSFLGDRYLSALVTNTSVDAKELLKLVLEDLGVAMEPGSDKSDLLIAFKKFLISCGRDGKRIIVVVDEAQNLSREALEEIRLLTNLGQGEEQPVQIVLVGQPELEAALQRPDLAQLRQRIRVHYKLSPLSRRELEEYVDHRMAVAGGVSGVFSKGALDRIYEASGGVPRVVNTLCGEALLAAYVAGRSKVEARDLEEQPSAVEPPALERMAPVVAPVTDSQSAAAPSGSTTGMAVRRGKATGGGEAPVAGPTPATTVKSAPARETASKRASRFSSVLIFASLAVVVVVASLAAGGRLEPLWSKVRPKASDETGMLGSRAEAARQAAVDQPAVAELGADQVASTIAVVPADSAGLGAQPVDSGTTVMVEGGGRAALSTSAADAAREAVANEESVPTAAPRPTLAAGGAEQNEVRAAPAGEFYIHVSSFRTPEQAASAARKLTESGLPSTVHRQLIRDVQWYRVYMGPFGAHEDAVHLANRLREEGTITYYKVIGPGIDEGQ